MDPTDIVLVPVELERSLIYVMGVLLYAVAIRSGRGTVHEIQEWILTTGLLFGAMIMAGASPFTNLIQTCLSALYLATLLKATPNLLGVDQKIPPVWDIIHIRHPKIPQVIVSQSNAQAIIISTIIASILRLYDRGWQMQRLPMPFFLGGYAGHAIGILVGYLRVKLITAHGDAA